MNNFIERKKEIINSLKAFMLASESENDIYLKRDIESTLHKSTDEAILLICKHQVKRNDISPEMKKYLIGKIYRAELIINKRNHPIYQFPWTHERPLSYKSSQDIAECIGEEYNVSSAAIIKYDLYTRAIDILTDRKSISVVDVLRGIKKIPAENIVQLSKMSDEDIEYLKILFNGNFYKMSGYISINDKKSQKDFLEYSNNTALIKQMPEHDPDAMMISLAFTVPSWINSIQKAISTSDMTLTSDSVRNTLRQQLTDLKKVITEILIRLEEKYYE